MTTNLAESVNGQLRELRCLPIFALVRGTYYKMNEIFCDRRAKVAAMLERGSRWSSDALERMSVETRHAATHKSILFDRAQGLFEVHQYNNRNNLPCPRKYTVNLTRGTCGCGRFQAIHMPCSHAISACSSISIDPWKYVHLVYSIQSVKKAYSGRFYPLGDDNNMRSVLDIKILPNPTMERAKGRPASNRIHNEMDWGERGSSSKSRMQNNH